MKKVVLILLVLLMAAPAMAVVTITVSDEGGGVARIGYSCDSADEDPCSPGKTIVAGLAIIIETSNTATITSVTSKVDGPSTAGNPGMGVFMKEAQIGLNGGDPCDPCWVAGTSPVADPCDPGTVGGLGETLVTLEVGVLFDPCDPCNAADLSGWLFDIQLADNGEADTDLTITAETTHRGGAVKRGGTATTLVQGASDTIQFACFSVGQVWGQTDAYELTVTQGMVDRWNGTTQTSDGQGGWINLASPDCWCNPCHVCGDSEELGDGGYGFITYIPDVKIVIDNWSGYDACADYDMNGFITYIPDVKTILDHWASGCTGLNPLGCANGPY